MINSTLSHCHLSQLRITWHCDFSGSYLILLWSLCLRLVVELLLLVLDNRSGLWPWHVCLCCLFHCFILNFLKHPAGYYWILISWISCWTWWFKCYQWDGASMYLYILNSWLLNVLFCISDYNFTTSKYQWNIEGIYGDKLAIGMIFSSLKSSMM